MCVGLKRVLRYVLIEQRTQRTLQLNKEGDISSIYEMPDINPDIRHSALFLTSKAASRWNIMLRAARDKRKL